MRSRFGIIKGLVLGLIVAVAGAGVTGCGMLNDAANNLQTTIQRSRFSEKVKCDGFEYAYRSSDNTGYLSRYYWDGSEENMYITMPGKLNDVTINRIGGIFGNGNPHPFGVDLKEGLKDRDVHEVSQNSNVVIDSTEYYDFYLIAEAERTDADSVFEMSFYESETHTLHISRVTVIDLSQTFTDTDEGRGLLPGLSDIEEITYRAEQLGTSNGRVPGPTDYRYWGVAYISDEEAMDIIDKYELEECELEIDATIAYLYRELPMREWKTSKQLAKDLIKAGCGGDVYMSGNVIYFVMHTS